MIVAAIYWGQTYVVCVSVTTGLTKITVMIVNSITARPCVVATCASFALDIASARLATLDLMFSRLSNYTCQSGASRSSFHTPTIVWVYSASSMMLAISEITCVSFWGPLRTCWKLHLLPKRQKPFWKCLHNCESFWNPDRVSDSKAGDSKAV
jgi:hypothetical protein